MAKLNPDETMVNARIVYWGIAGAGKSANLHSIYRKLRPDSRGEIEREATRIDSTVEYETLPIELGEIRGLRTRIQMIAVPGGEGQAPTRKQLLDQIDGVVMVVDSRRECIDDNAASLNELREMLRDYGRALEDVPLVLQYNKRDLSDPYVLEELHRRLDVKGAAVFEAVAVETIGVLQTLSTLAKHVIRSLRGQRFDSEHDDSDESGLHEEGREQPGKAAQDTAPGVESTSEPTPSSRIEDEILSEEEHHEANAIDDLTREAQEIFDAPWDEVSVDVESPQGAQLDTEFAIASVGEATRSGDRGIRIPLVIADKQGRNSKLILTIQLDPLLEGDPD
jgi:signal recognition particle receptor subunit beta